MKSFPAASDELLPVLLRLLLGSLLGGEQREVKVPKEEAKLLIQDFDPTKEYTFWVTAVNGDQESKVLEAKHEGETRSCSGSSGVPHFLCSVPRFYMSHGVPIHS